MLTTRSRSKRLTLARSIPGGVPLDRGNAHLGIVSTGKCGTSKYLALCGVNRYNEWIRPLGSWMRAHNSGWKWWYSHESDRLYAHHNTFWWEFNRRGHRRRGRSILGTFAKVGPVTSLSGGLLRADVSVAKGKLKLLQVGKPAVTSAPLEVDKNWRDWVHRYERWALEHVIINDKIELLVDSIRRGTAIAVRDGS